TSPATIDNAITANAIFDTAFLDNTNLVNATLALTFFGLIEFLPVVGRRAPTLKEAFCRFPERTAHPDLWENEKKGGACG
ncbi:MAG: hypothetical protein WB562_05935, partial [Candidatus Sulfotelmatobacter sp.]